MPSRRTTTQASRSSRETDDRLPVTVLAGFRPAPKAAVARDLLASDPHLLLVGHDLASVRDGTVHRVVRRADELIEDDTVTLSHGCVACTLREDVLPTLVRLASGHPRAGVLLMLPEVVEPQWLTDAVADCAVGATAVADVIRIDSVITVVDATGLLPDLTTTDELGHRGLAAADDDHRAVADVVARQIEDCDTVLLWGDDSGAERLRVASLLRHLAPWTRLVDAKTHQLYETLRGTWRHDPDVPTAMLRGLEGLTIGVEAATPDWGVSATVFRSRRPFHPERFHSMLGLITNDALRSRGHLWIASQPDTVIAWELAGAGLSVGSLGRWLAAAPDEDWAEASPQRRTAATLAWDPYYGDRGTQLAFVGVDLDTAKLHKHLTACLLTDAELAEGQATWQTWPDPFAGCFDTPDDH